MDLLQSVDPTKSGAFSDPLRPSFYELAAQEQLQDLLKPCLRYILSVLAQRNPRYLLRIVNRFDEVYALMMWAIERHYLTTWGSSFAENFYGLRRRRRPGIATPRAKTASSARSTQQAMEALRPIDIQVSLFTLVALPYIQTKLHDRWEAEGGGLDAEQGGGLFGDDDEEQQAVQGGASSSGGGSSGNQRRAFVEESEGRRSQIAKLQSLLRLSFKKGYPYVGAAWQLWLLSYNVRYLFDKTPFWRPWLRLMRMDVRRVGMNDYPPSPPLIPPNLPSPISHPLPFALGLLRSSPFIFFEALKYALPASIFFFKFLEWWYSPDNARRRRPGGGAAGSGAVGKDGRPFNLDPPKILLPHLKGVLYSKPSSFKETPIPKTKLGLESSSNDDEEGGEKPREKVGLTHNGCPICGTAPINNPTMFPTGYVCCYTCAFAYVEEHHQCPVTLRKVADTSDLRRVLG